jgi:hypothetical protein
MAGPCPLRACSPRSASRWSSPSKDELSNALPRYTSRGGEAQADRRSQDHELSLPHPIPAPVTLSANGRPDLCLDWNDGSVAQRLQNLRRLTGEQFLFASGFGDVVEQPCRAHGQDVFAKSAISKGYHKIQLSPPGQRRSRSAMPNSPVRFSTASSTSSVYSPRGNLSRATR